VVSDDNGQITSFQEKPSVEQALSNKVNTGIYIFEPEVLDLIPSGQEYDIGSDLFPKIVEQGLKFNAIDLPFNWIDIGKISDYWEANQKIMSGELRSIPMPGTEVNSIRENARISKSIIFEYTRIGSASIVKNSVAFGRFFVDKDGKAFESESMNLDWVTDSRIQNVG